MAKKGANKKIYSEEVGSSHELDEARLEAIRQAWSAPVPLQPLALPRRPERPYSRDKRGGSSLAEALGASAEHEFSAYRTHYDSHEAVLTSEDFQLSPAEARDAFYVETRPEKYAQKTWPALEQLPPEDEAIDPAEIGARFAAHVQDFLTVWAPHNLNALNYLAGFLSLLVGPLETLRLWTVHIPQASWSDLFELLTVAASEEEEAALAAELVALLDGVDVSQMKSWHRGALFRLADQDRLVAMVRESPQYFGVKPAAVALYHAMNDPALYVSQIQARDGVTALLDEERFEALLALGGPEAFAPVLPIIGNLSKVTDKKNAVKGVSRLHAPALIAPLFGLVNDKKVGKLVEAHLLHEGANAIVGLAEEANLRTKAGKLAIDYLCRYRDMGHGELIGRLVEAHGSEQARQVVAKNVIEHYSAQKEEITASERPEWLDALIADKGVWSKSLPSFITLESLPPLQTRERALLPDQSRELLVRLLKESTSEAPHPGLAQFREWLEPHSAETFVHALFEAWVRSGAHANYTWIINGLAQFGTLYTPDLMEEQLRTWRRDIKRYAKHYVEGLEALATLFLERGHETALATLLSLPSISGYEFRRANLEHEPCGVVLKRIAKEKQCTKAALVDMSVPKLGFNARGEREFDYGPRQFTLRLGEGFSPVFISHEGEEKLSKSLPRPRKTDDAEKVDLAQADYERDRKLISKTLEQQQARFQKAMREGHAWPRELWEEQVYQHPLIKNFARGLLWCEGAGEGTRVFRVTDEFELADAQDEPFELARGAKIRVARSEDFSPQQRKEWGQILSDYEVLQPFEQLE